MPWRWGGQPGQDWVMPRNFNFLQKVMRSFWMIRDEVSFLLWEITLAAMWRMNWLGARLERREVRVIQVRNEEDLNWSEGNRERRAEFTRGEGGWRELVMGMQGDPGTAEWERKRSNFGMGVEELTCCDEHWALYVTNESWNTASETNDVLYSG